jgi:DNA-binding NarL/FixJ family response regulator
MTATRVEVRPGAYYDSIVLMHLQAALASLDGVLDSGVIMGTPSNKELLAQSGLIAPEVDAAKPEKALEDTTGWDSTLIDMWNKGHSRDEIANRVNVSKDRVTNRVTELRNKFGEDIVPYHKDRKKRLIKS